MLSNVTRAYDAARRHRAEAATRADIRADARDRARDEAEAAAVYQARAETDAARVRHHLRGSDYADA